MKYLLNIIIYFLLGNGAFAQSGYLQARVKGFGGSRAFLMQFKGDGQEIIDSATCLDGVFEFRFSPDVKPGIYRVVLGSSSKSNFFEEDPGYFDFIYNHENIILNTNVVSLTDSMEIMQSGENRVFNEYNRANDSFQSRLQRLVPLFEVYGDADSFYPALSGEFKNIQAGLTQVTLRLEESLPGSIAASVIRASILPEVENTGSPAQMKSFVRDHFFDLKSFSDPRLINSPIYTGIVIDYLGLWRSPGFTQSQQEEQFILAVDNIMEAVSADPAVYDFMLNFLVDGFQKFQMEKVLVHIAENYVEGGCETDSKKLLQKRLEGYERMSPGKKAPDILNFDQNGDQVRLYDMDHEYTLVLFWASWCPHCTIFMNQLSKWYPQRKIDIGIYAVSIDSSKFAWEERIMMDNYPWINTFSGAGWDGKAPKDYNVYATPTLFLLDRDHKIIAKPMTFREFKKEAENLVSN